MDPGRQPRVDAARAAHYDCIVVMRTLNELPTPLGIRVLVALDQVPSGLRLSALASSLHAPLTTVDAAVRKMVAAGLVETTAERAYFIRETPQTALLLGLGLSTDEGIAAAVLANPLVRYAGHDAAGWLVAARARRADPSYARLLRVTDASGGRVEIVEPEGLTRGELDLYSSRAQAATTIAGMPSRAFPRPSREGRGGGRPLHRLNPLIDRPSTRSLRAVARDYGLRRLVVFGSAVRDDFEDDSDVDLLVESRPGQALGITDLVGLEDRLEKLFRRPVDVVTPRGLRSEVVQIAEQEGVPLFG